jgi:hypothetical protein
MASALFWHALEMLKMTLIEKSLVVTISFYTANSKFV